MLAQQNRDHRQWRQAGSGSTEVAQDPPQAVLGQQAHAIVSCSPVKEHQHRQDEDKAVKRLERFLQVALVVLYRLPGSGGHEVIMFRSEDNTMPIALFR